MGRRRGGGQHSGLPKAPPVRELSLALLCNCRGSVVSAEVLKGRRHHAELSTLVSLSVYLPPAENPPPIIWATAHAAFLPATNSDIKYCVFRDL